MQDWERICGGSRGSERFDGESEHWDMSQETESSDRSIDSGTLLIQVPLRKALQTGMSL